MVIVLKLMQTFENAVINVCRRLLLVGDPICPDPVESRQIAEILRRGRILVSEPLPAEPDNSLSLRRASPPLHAVVDCEKDDGSDSKDGTSSDAVTTFRDGSLSAAITSTAYPNSNDMANPSTAPVTSPEYPNGDVTYRINIPDGYSAKETTGVG